ncbi:hypothetical protein, conserved [Eimeria praecox]|uniref:Uncharacterized protein n=1 Tax=Eimeria praecox TaxID=51316 RepID=U6GUH8_9EIME|nr:hypothetical protein, conserved [Eimeria praecox]
MLLFGRRNGAGPGSANGGICARNCSDSNSSSTDTELDRSGGDRSSCGSCNSTGNTNGDNSEFSNTNTINSSSSNATNSNTGDLDTQRTSSTAQRTPEEMQRRATAIREAMATCSGLKEQYDRCFNHCVGTVIYPFVFSCFFSLVCSSYPSLTWPSASLGYWPVLCLSVSMAVSDLQPVGDMSRNCFHLFADYRLCISEELKRKGLE